MHTAPSPLATSFIRTFTPGVAAVILSLLARANLDIDTATFNGFLELSIAAGWYGTSRVLEAKVDRRFGWLLGKAAQPAYVEPLAEPPAFTPNQTLDFGGTVSEHAGAPSTFVVNIYNGLGGATMTTDPPDIPVRT